MTSSLWLAAALSCAQFGPEQDVPPPKPATSKIVAATVYQGQALVTREVSVPEGGGTVELVVTPLPAQAVNGSLYTEGADGLRVLSTRFRTRVVKDDSRKEVRTREELIKKLQADAQRIQKEVEVQEQDLKYIQKLEGFTGTSLTGLTEKGRLDSEPILELSKFMMETRASKTSRETDLRQQLQTNAETAEFAKRQLAEISAGSSKIERDAVIVVHKTRPDAGTVRLGYLVGAASWQPQYRLRGAADNAPVRLEYLAAVVQHTGEAWPDVRVTLSTARPSLDASPPELLPLKMAADDASESGPISTNDNGSQRIAAELEKQLEMPFAKETSLADVVAYIRANTRSQAFPEGIPIYIDPEGLNDADKTLASTVVLELKRVPLRTSLKLLLKQLGLIYQVGDGLLKITTGDSGNGVLAGGFDEGSGFGGGFGGMGGGMGGMGMSIEQAQATGGARLNQAAARDQAEELRVADGPNPDPLADEKDGPSVTFAVAGRLDIPSRQDPQLLEVARVELPAEYFDKAVPVLTQRVYRQAKLTNKSDYVLLPGEATVYVGSDFVGRMRLPLVAAGEPFVAGFGVDTQVQVSRRLMKKARTVQGGNQIFTYEFRIGIRNYRSGPVNVQLWDRLPKPQGESVVVNLVKTSDRLSTDKMFERTAKMDNLLRWDLVGAAGTIGEKTKYLTYEFRLEYARDLPQPRFLSAGLREGPIGGGAMGGGMGGGMRSVEPARN